MPNRKPKCKTKYCRNAPGKRIGGLCYKCHHKKKKARNPMRYAYGVLRRNARRRGIPFTISFEYFERFCVKYDYIARKGRSAESLTVDRIDNRLGYVPGNLRAISNAENSRKGVKVLAYNYVTGSANVYVLSAKKMDYDTPF